MKRLLNIFLMTLILVSTSCASLGLKVNPDDNKQIAGNIAVAILGADIAMEDQDVRKLSVDILGKVKAVLDSYQYNSDSAIEIDLSAVFDMAGKEIKGVDPRIVSLCLSALEANLGSLVITVKGDTIKDLQNIKEILGLALERLEGI